MTLFILDPSLESVHGHHMQWNMTIASAAKVREQDVTIIANKTCSLSIMEGIEILPWFSHTCYTELSTDRIAGKFDDFRVLNDELAEELRLLPRDRFRATDVVMTPTITEKHLLGYVSWMKSFDPLTAPLFIVHLMFPSGLGALDSKGLLSISEPQQALFYTLAFRVAAGPGPRIHFFGGGRQLAREFSDLLGTAIEAHPIPNCPKRRSPPPGSGERPAALLFMGDAKVDKGFLLVPELARTLSLTYPGWDFIAHANAGAAWGEALTAYGELMLVAEQQPNVRVSTGRLSRDEYLQVMESADCYICSYDPVVYARKSSGVVWESVSLGMPVLAPSDTWLDYEPKEWGAGHLGFQDYSVDGIVEAFAVFQEQLPALVQRSATAAKRYHAHNGSDALMNQIGALWAPRLMAASLTTMPVSQALPIERFDRGWHFVEQMDGAAVRWTAKEFSIRFEWPHNVGWTVEFEVLNYIAVEQLTGAKVFVGGNPADSALTLLGHGRVGGTLRVRGAGQGRANPEIDVRVELPWTYRPENDPRDLGVFVRAVKVEPGRDLAESSAVPFEVASPITRSDDGLGFLLQGIVSGYAPLDPARGGEICFTMRTDRPDLARSVLLFVNGTPLPRDVSAIGPDLWQATATCPPYVLSRRGYRAEWDLQLAAEEPDASVWITEIGLSGQQPDGRLATKENAAPEALPVTAPVEDISSAASRDWQPTLDTARLNEHYVGSRTYAHIDMSLFGLAIEGQFWAEIRLKFCASHSRHYIEFRNLSGWPQVFSFWTSAEIDQFGPLIQIGDMHPLPGEANHRERLLIQAIAAVLPRAVEAIARRSEPANPEWAVWAERAEQASRDWAGLSSIIDTAEAA